MGAISNIIVLIETSQYEKFKENCNMWIISRNFHLLDHDAEYENRFANFLYLQASAFEHLNVEIRITTENNLCDMQGEWSR